MRTITCFRCQMQFGMPDDFYRTAQQMAERMTWYCPAGHPQVFKSGETEADILRRERDRLKQQLAQKDDDIRWQKERREAAERSTSALRGQVTKLRNRASAGVCPCCNRTVSQMARHMATKHPGFKAEEVA